MRGGINSLIEKKTLTFLSKLSPFASKNLSIPSKIILMKASTGFSVRYHVFNRLLAILLIWQNVLADAYENVTGIVSGDIVQFKLNPAKMGIDRRWPNVNYYRSKSLELVSENGRKLISKIPDGFVAVSYFKNFLDADALALWNEQQRKLHIYRMNTTSDCTFNPDTEYQIPQSASIRFIQFVRSKSDFRFLSHNAYFIDKSENPAEPKLKYFEKGQQEPSESILNDRLESGRREKFAFWTIGSGNNFSLIAPLNPVAGPSAYGASNHLVVLEVGIDDNTNRTTEIIHDLAAAMARASISTEGFQFGFISVVETSLKNAAAVSFGYKSVIFGGKDYTSPSTVVLYNCILEQSKETQCMQFFTYYSTTGTPEILFVDSGETNSTSKLVPTRVVLRVPDTEPGTFKTLQFVVNYTLTITSAPEEKDASKITFTRSATSFNPVPIPYSWLNLTTSCSELVQDRVLNIYKGTCTKENFMMTVVEDAGYTEKPKTFSGPGFLSATH